MEYNNALSAPMQTTAINAAAPKSSPKKKDAGDNRGELQSISIDVTENGFEVTCSYEPKKLNPKMDRWNQMPQPTKMSFEGTPSALAYVTKMMSGAAGEECAGDDAAGDDSY